MIENMSYEEWAKQEDEKYLQHLKDQINYFNQRLVVRTMENSEIRNLLHEFVDILEAERERLTVDFRRTYGNKTRKCIFSVVVERSEGEDGVSEATDNVASESKQEDPRHTVGQNDGDRGTHIDGQDNAGDANHNGPGVDRSTSNLFKL